MEIGPESRFTAPRQDCPHPERWHSTDDDSTEIEVSRFVGGLVTALQPDFVLETGTAWGQTAEEIGKSLRENGRGRLVTLEVDPLRVTYSRERCEGLPVTVLQQGSLDYEPVEQIDFAWFDSLFNLRGPEFRRYLPQLRKGAIVGFHDTGPQHPLRPSIQALADEGLVRVMYFPTPRGFALGEVL